MNYFFKHKLTSYCLIISQKYLRFFHLNGGKWCNLATNQRSKTSVKIKFINIKERWRILNAYLQKLCLTSAILSADISVFMYRESKKQYNPCQLFK